MEARETGSRSIFGRRPAAMNLAEITKFESEGQRRTYSDTLTKCRQPNTGATQNRVKGGIPHSCRHQIPSGKYTGISSTFNGARTITTHLGGA
jgi:hypothetical protein